MTREMVFACGLLCLLFSHLAYGQAADEQPCSAAIHAAVEKRLGGGNFILNPDDADDNGGRIVSEACKVWPKDRSITIAAFAYDSVSDPDTQLVKVAVAMVDNRRNRVIGLYQGEIEEGAETQVDRNSLWLDTARYNLAPGVRAFGLVIRNGHMPPTCAGAGINSHLMLFVREGEQIRPVLEEFELETWNEQGNTRCGDGDVEYEFTTVHYTLAIGKASSHGYANLLVTGNQSDMAPGKPGLKPFRFELRYDGKQYSQWPGLTGGRGTN